MHQLEQLRPRLLLCRVDVLIPVDDIDIDGEPVGAAGQRLISARNFGIALRSEMPDRSGILDEEREIMLGHQIQRARGVSADSVFHPRIEAVVNMRERHIKIRLDAPQCKDLAKPILLHASRELGAKIQKGAQPGLVLARAKHFERIESVRLTERRTNIVVHRGEARGVARAFQRFKIELRQIHTIPIETRNQRLHTIGDRPETIAICEIHELAPIELGVLQHGGLLAPFGMIVPEFLADVRKLEPGVNENSLPMAGGDQRIEVSIALRVRFIEMPGGDVQRSDSRGSPARGEIIDIHTHPVGVVEERPQPARAERRVEPEIGQRVQQVGKALISLLARTDRDPEDRARAPPVSGQHRRPGRALGRKHLRGAGNRETRRIDGLLPNDRQRGTARIDNAAYVNALFATLKSERLRRWRLPFENHNSAPLHAAGPFLRRCGRASQHEHARQIRVLPDESDRG